MVVMNHEPNPKFDSQIFNLKEGFIDPDFSDISSDVSADLYPDIVESAGLGPETSRAKSALRLKYEAESEVIRRKLGDLEAIRSQLGLSQRKMAQLLLVDPSAWTRWTKGGETVPPHVYRSLQWYLALEEKYPALDVNFWLSTVSQVNERSRVPELESQIIESESRLARVETQLQQLNKSLDLHLNSITTAISQQTVEQTLKALRLEMNQKDRANRRFLIWVAGSILASSLVLGLLISLLNA